VDASALAQHRCPAESARHQFPTMTRDLAGRDAGHSGEWESPHIVQSFSEAAES
jgi:hypothetical protein